VQALSLPYDPELHEGLPEELESRQGDRGDQEAAGRAPALRRPMSTELGRLRWRSRRGMRELDAVLLAFLDRSFEKLNDADKARYDALLNLPDPELYDYLVRRHEPQDKELARLVAIIRGGDD